MRVIAVKKEQILIVLYCIVIVAGFFIMTRNKSIETFSMPVSKKTIAIDAGHGGWDPGKVGSTENLEKDINLQIAKKLQSYLEQGGSTVLMTRTVDEALADSKREDMKERIVVANNTKADLLVSIHQNSYPNSQVEGAQVFYFDNAKDSKRLAELVQEEVRLFVDSENNRVAKPSTSYYLLKKSAVPAVIVECGFLSNPKETNKLTDEEYQEKISWAIYKGIIRYFDEKEGF